MSDEVLVYTLEHHNGLGSYLAFQEDGRWLFHRVEGNNISILNMKRITGLAYANQHVVVATDTAEVRSHDPTGDFEDLLFQQTHTVHALALNSSGTWIACAEDLKIRIPGNLQDGHSARVRSLSWHPKKPWLTSCGSDGNVIIWSLEGTDDGMSAKKYHTVRDVLPLGPKEDSNLEANLVAQNVTAHWHPFKDEFYVIGKDNAVTIVDTATWKQSRPFEASRSTHPPSCIALSPNGEYLVTAHLDRLLVWTTKYRTVISTLLLKNVDEIATPAIICNISWCPIRNLIAWVDVNGRFVRWTDPIPETYPPPYRQLGTNEKVPGGKEDSPVKRHKDLDRIPAEPSELEDVFDDGDLQDDDHMPIDDDMEEDAGEEDVASDDEHVKQMVNITKAQPPFQPGATPLIGEKRYLASNLLGHVELSKADDTRSHIGVFFSNESKRQNFRLTETDRTVDMAYLGERGLVLACQPSSSDPGEVRYHPYGSQARPWIYPLTNSRTKILGVAAGGISVGKNEQLIETSDSLEGYGTVVVATSDDDLTFLTGTGHERRILGLGKDFVTMVASDDWVFVVHRAGGTTLDGSQNLSYSMINFADFTVRQRDVLPIPRKQTLLWVGLTDQGAPAIYDSAGRLHVMSKHRIPHHASWTRVLDTNELDRKAGKQESYWPLGLDGQTFMCWIIKGQRQYPSWPTPTISEIEVRFPFRRSERPEDESIERDMFFHEFQVDNLGEELTTKELASEERKMDKILIRMLQAALKEGNLARGFEICKLLYSPASLKAAIEVANYHHEAGFRRRIEQLQDSRAAQTDRMVEQREQRLQWDRAQARPTRVIDSVSSTHSGMPANAFQAKEAPSGHRPGLSKATPVAEDTRYSAGRGVEERVHDISISRRKSPTFNVDGKRKRSDEDDMDTENFSALDEPSSSLPPPTKKGNPFAKKPAVDPTRNPFGRNANSNKTIEKSESFFEKAIDAGDKSLKTKVSQTGTKTKQGASVKEGSRQSTLVGMFKQKDSQPIESETLLEDSRSPTQEPETNEESPMEIDDSQEDVETQPIDVPI
ncbi:hypothetical protein DL96DRAFT_1599042 [Flagelloscypha sp. PMI_526]|nr:hypothetical protein DL96DRAFT_1599042 [Flagelloscypha sp. PMI_526]